MKNIKITSAIIIIALLTINTSCNNNHTEHEGHNHEAHEGHEHGVNGEHLDDHGHAHDELHTQETFEVTSDSLSKKSEENKPHTHDGETEHKH